MAKKTWYVEGTYYAEHRAEILAAAKAAHHAKNEQAAGRPKPETCEICGKKQKLTFDHCHQKGKFRGWICYSCNIALGKIEACGIERLLAYLNQTN